MRLATEPFNHSFKVGASRLIRPIGVDEGRGKTVAPTLCLPTLGQVGIGDEKSAKRH